MVIFPTAGNSLVAADVTHYLVPDCHVAGAFLEIMELPEFTSIVFMQTVLHHVRRIRVFVPF